MSLIISSTGARQLPAELVNNSMEISGLSTPVMSEMLTPLEDCPITLSGAFGAAKESTQFTSKDISATARWSSSLMNENDEDTRPLIVFYSSSKAPV